MDERLISLSTKSGHETVSRTGADSQRQFHPPANVLRIRGSVSSTRPHAGVLTAATDRMIV